MKRRDVVTYEHVSDIPQAELAGLTCEEMLAVFWTRYRKAGQPQDKLIAWLDAHYVGSPKADPERRVMGMDWWGLCSLLEEARVWLDERFPPRSDLA